jgi:thymidylate kinase
MTENTLSKLFKEFNKNKINYIIRGKYKHLPDTLNGGDVDILIDKKDFRKIKKILRIMRFIYYPFAKPHFFYYFYDKDLGLIQLDILLTSNFPKKKKYNEFFIPENNKFITIKKSFFARVSTYLKRKSHFLFRGKLICFVGPDGSGKSTLAQNSLKNLSKFPIQKKYIHFGSLKPAAVYRAIDRIKKLLIVYYYLFIGKIVITDRYIYLTFRKSFSIFSKLIQFIAPKPNIVFVLKSTEKTLQKRRGKDSLNSKDIFDLYTLFEKIKRKIDVNSEKSEEECLEFLINKILNLYR